MILTLSSISTIYLIPDLNSSSSLAASRLLESILSHENLNPPVDGERCSYSWLIGRYGRSHTGERSREDTP
jgi:hypothetical protein